VCSFEIWQAAATEYKKAHPATKVRFDYLDHEAFKANLPMLLQSSDRPNVFHSWGGGVMLEQIQAGVCQDITDAIAEDFKDSFYSAGVQAFMSQGRSYGVVRTPMNDYIHDSPEVAKSAPGMQQWYQNLYAQGLDTPIERSVHLVLRLAAGDADNALWPLYQCGG
jgi:ABC-type glycerol-3-phosphate transport system substrate-binding protein